MPDYGRPTAPNPSPAIATGLYANPANRGVNLQTLIGRLPTYGSWDEAIRSPSFAGLSDQEKTQALGSTYGLSQQWKVQGNQLVNADPWLARNAWWLAPAALVGGSAAFGALGGGAGAGAGVGALGPSTAGNIAATTAAASAAPSALAASGGGMTLGQLFLTHGLGPSINAGANLFGSHQAGSAADRAYQQQIADARRTFELEQARDLEARRQWDIQQANEAEQRAFDRQQIADREARAAPYRAASLAALGRLPDLISTGGTTWRSPSQAGRR